MYIVDVNNRSKEDIHTVHKQTMRPLKLNVGLEVEPLYIVIE